MRLTFGLPTLLLSLVGNKNILIFSILFLAVLGISAYLYINNSKNAKFEQEMVSVSEKAPEEKVSITPENQDLGEVIYGDVAETQFILKNLTGNALKITRVSTSCSCTKATVEKENLNPSEEVPVNVTFDPAVHKDDTDIGDITRTIYISTDNPDFSQLEASITAHVVKK